MRKPKQPTFDPLDATMAWDLQRRMKAASQMMALWPADSSIHAHCQREHDAAKGELLDIIARADLSNDVEALTALRVAA